MKKVVLIMLLASMVLVMAGCPANDNRDPEKEGVTVGTPTPGTTDTPTPTVVVDNRTKVTMSQLLAQSSDKELVLFALDGEPSATALVEAVLVFRGGKVKVYDTNTVNAQFTDPLIDGIISIPNDELIRLLDERYTALAKATVTEFLEKYPEAAAMVCVQKNGEPAAEWEGRDYLGECGECMLCPEEPAEYDYYTLLYTDASGKNVVRESLIVPQAWETDALICRDGDTLVEKSFSDGSVRGTGAAIVGYEDETLAQTDIDLWNSKYKAVLSEISENGYSSDGRPITVMDGFTIDAKQPVDGVFGDVAYSGFLTEDGKSVVAVCGPDTVFVPDTAETAAAEGNITVNPDFAAETSIRYAVNRSMLNSAESAWEKESVTAYLQDYLDKDLAYDFVNHGNRKFGCYLLTELGFAEEAEQILAQADPDEDRDLGGMELVICNWWDNGDVVPGNEREEIIDEYRKSMMEAHNFTVSRRADYNWGDQAESCVLSITTDQPLGDVLTVDYRFLGGFMDSERPLFADVSKLDEFDFSDDKWNQQVLECMTVGDAVYGFALTKEPTVGIYWNKDLLEKLMGAGAGDLPYDWQASGEWTWDKFKEFSRECTVDLNADGITDIYGLAAYQTLLFEMAMISDNHQIISRDTRGRYLNNATSAEIIADCNWAYSFYEEDIARRMGSNDNWDYFQTDFLEQKAVMLTQEAYYAQTLNAAYDPVTDEYRKPFEFGFVCFPKGPNADGYVSLFHDNVLVIPNCESTMKRIEDIAFAFNVYTDIPEEAEAWTDYWKTSYDYCMDDRAVNETIRMMLFDNRKVSEAGVIVPGLWDNAMGVIQCGFLYVADGADMTPAERLNLLNPTIQASVDEFNSRIK